MTNNEKEIATEEQDFGVQIPLTAFNVMVRYQGEFGVPDTLHVMLEFDQSGYYLDEIIIGKITLLLIKIDIKRVEIFIVKTETYGRKINSIGGEEIHTDEEVVYRTELKKNPKKNQIKNADYKYSGSIIFIKNFSSYSQKINTRTTVSFFFCKSHSVNPKMN